MTVEYRSANAQEMSDILNAKALSYISGTELKPEICRVPPKVNDFWGREGAKA